MKTWNRIDYLGWNNCFCFESAEFKVIVATDIGPRVIHFSSPEGENLFYIDEETIGQTGGNEWKMYGGHRFWTSPESKERTYIADNFPALVEVDGNSISITARVEPTGFQKTLILTPLLSERLLKVTHVLTNKNKTPVEVAPWGLSVMHKGGTAIIPLPAKAMHTELLTPTLSFAHWGYTDLTDPRWGWGEQFLFLRQDEHMENPQKIGVHSGKDWAAYLNNSSLFIKMAKFNPEAVYPDYGSHFEFFTNDFMLEIESLGALTKLQPGEQLTHEEYWSVFDNVKTVISEEGVIRNILPLVDQVKQYIR